MNRNLINHNSYKSHFLSKNMEKEVKKPVKYSSTVSRKKETLSDTIKRAVPPSMIPTKKTSWIFGALFVIVVIIGILSFPLDSLLAGQTDVSVDVGIPWTFLKFDVENPETLPVRFGGLILDLIIYLILAYAIDVAINSFYRSGIFSKKRFKSKRPGIYKIPQKSTTQKIAEKAAIKTHQIIKQKSILPKPPKPTPQLKPPQPPQSRTFNQPR